MDQAQTPREELWFFSRLLKLPVSDSSGRRLGRLVDLVAEARDMDSPVTGLILAGPHQRQYLLPWSQVVTLRPSGLEVGPEATLATAPTTQRPGEILLHKGLLDKQIVDTAGAKVVRVNDLQLRRSNGVLTLIKVDVGFKGLLRRVGLLRGVEALVKWLFGAGLPENLITWQLVQPVESADILQLKFSQSRLARLHPADLADIIEDLDQPARARLFRALDLETAADTLEEADPKVQTSLIENLPEETASDILEQMSPSEATDILQSLDEDKAADILESMEEEQAESVRCLMTHEEDTAGGLMTTSFLSLAQEETVEQALVKLRREAPDLDVIYYGYVEDEAGHLQGVVNLRELLAAAPQAKMGSIMITRPVSVLPDADPDEVAEIFAKYGLRAVPVVDEHGLLHGVIRFKALLETVAPHLGR